MIADAALALLDSDFTATPGARLPHRLPPRHALRAWSSIAPCFRPAKALALFLDFDGTLAPIRRRPEEVHCSERIREVLARLARIPHLWIGIVSGRRSKFLAGRIAVPGIHYCGVYGAERGGQPVKLPTATRRALVRARRELARPLARIPGVWIEDKGLSFVIHFRGARESRIAAVQAPVRRALTAAGDSLRILAANKTWECLPRAIPGKGAAISSVMNSLPPGGVAIYIGDDAADEEAFQVLPHGVTIRVGRSKTSLARYFLRGPGEVWQWLARLEEALA